MKWIVSPLVFAAAANAHAIFQKVFVNGADQGLLVGLRAPSTNNPISTVTDANFACDTPGSTSSTIINVKAGDTIGSYWQHIIGGPQGTNDPDNPIAPSHKGPIQAYLAKVDNAATASSTGQKWFKVASEGLSGGKWAVDTMIANGGLWSFQLPQCIAPGNYLLRVELLALHNAYSQNGEQFYMSCAQINVTSGGSFSPSTTVSFPGSYSATDPGILINIYDSSGQPTNGGKTYVPPGPAVITCDGSNSNPTTVSSSSSTRASSSSSSTRTSSTSTRASTTSSANGSGQTLYGQCGGQGWTGPTTCASGTCKASNQWYSQCLP
ncbi:Probable endo-beta-1,4-glucanase D Short=Endoglucanase D; AltName: Full=Carboxymethylcellulase D; AltName: Full=Cellulase D; Flags: Precursor [Serendipita indica DSM 11827]|uniref:AA9 family lytic polysaccharide monooxygenase n=1 Tax=Serendipita indica (strain DSM 11827) TaxID=1109443 RepID=G4TLJ9_SERID|nr:Probable endo-beta-1,4-glucanase D Short=Endoglucanase D; AltName: Full=Carboxymethylcellulase D; AltName: Full=Cellulase D; Flags: Precursor [Serendipita indica DSM 11827]CCA72192.1 related to endoglucanase B [Serendipita indica DSM 11827]